jgi:hypothetical protein
MVRTWLGHRTRNQSPSARFPDMAGTDISSDGSGRYVRACVSVCGIERVRHDRQERADISHIMLSRAILGYALPGGAAVPIPSPPNHELDLGDGCLTCVWDWVSYHQDLYLLGNHILEGRDFCLDGVLAIVQSGWDASRGTGHPCGKVLKRDPIQEFCVLLPVTVYEDAWRRLALQTLGFGVSSTGEEGLRISSNAGLLQEIQDLEAGGEFGKAAFMGAFYLHDVGRAVESLQASEDSTMRVLATALLAYCSMMRATDARTGSTNHLPDMWRNMCDSARCSLHDPYLVALMEFLGSQGDLAGILASRQLHIIDRITLALHFAPYPACVSFLESLVTELVQSGDVRAVMLVGLHSLPAMRQVLQPYLDRTGDVQSCALLGSLVCPRKFADPYVDQWVEGYRQLLNRWKLFHARAHFDIARRAGAKRHPFAATSSVTGAADLVPAQLVIRCAFCQTSLSHTPAPVTNVSVVLAPAPNACPHCRKPMPKCSLCLLPVGMRTNATGKGTSPLEDWCVVCIRCQHGGHAGHYQAWFARHDVCPVGDCSCKCNVSTTG